MALFDKLKKTISDATDNVVKNVQNIGESVKDIKVDEMAKNISKMGEDAINNIKIGGSDLIDNAKAQFAKKEEPTELITDMDALKIIYCMMCADGEVQFKEREKFDAIGLDIDKDFLNFRETIIEECYGQISKAEDEEEKYDIILEIVRKCLLNSQSVSQGSIQPKLLLWNLVVVAFSDGEYSETERRLIRSVIRQLDLDKAIMPEMESTVQTLVALEKEEEWLKTTDRKYSEVEVYMNEIEDRKTAIMQGIHALLLD